MLAFTVPYLEGLQYLNVEGFIYKIIINEVSRDNTTNQHSLGIILFYTLQIPN